ncbi:MAG: 3-deoxy-D-manno-octulosonic acid transferase [Bacteroidetes bacterium]|nr:3-deoxy-D-manno-octulosonic acid transferase [Bacteroidota bacterium]
MLYNLGMFLLNSAIKIAAPFNPKAKLWCKGREHLLEKIETAMLSVKGRVVWFHCASLGEFEQGRQLIEDWKKRHENDTIVLTFYSPSGYEMRKDYKGADFVYYLPLDSSSNAQRFVKALNPKYAFFIKYEYWNNYLRELKNNGTKTYLVSAIFRKNDLFFKSYGNFHRSMLLYFDNLFVQNEESKQLLSTIGINNVNVFGDTRFDRVYNIISQTRKLEKIEAFAEGKEVFICGSSWPKDDEIVVSLIEKYKDISFIIVPHEIGEAKIVALVEKISKLGRECVRYSKCEKIENYRSSSVVVVDVIGILSSIYKYGRYGYIGGGFGVGIHNTLEAATFGLPLIFGSNYKRFDEAVSLVKLGSAQPINGFEEASKWLETMRKDKELYEKLSKKSAEFVEKNIGATSKIFNFIEE